jgi:hypothetical protein
MTFWHIYCIQIISDAKRENNKDEKESLAKSAEKPGKRR